MLIYLTPPRLGDHLFNSRSFLVSLGGGGGGGVFQNSQQNAKDDFILKTAAKFEDKVSSVSPAADDVTSPQVAHAH